MHNIVCLLTLVAIIAAVAKLHLFGHTGYVSTIIVTTRPVAQMALAAQTPLCLIRQSP
jgi:hypothetical protein